MTGGGLYERGTPNAPRDRGPIYWEAVARRGGHEYTGGEVEWEPTPRTCAGCEVCRDGIDWRSFVKPGART